MVFHPFTFLPLACTCVGWQGICQWLNRSLEKEMVSGHPLGKEAASSQWIRVTVDIHCPSEKSWRRHFTDHISSCALYKRDPPPHPPSPDLLLKSSLQPSGVPGSLGAPGDLRPAEAQAADSKCLSYQFLLKQSFSVFDRIQKQKKKKKKKKKLQT